MRSDCEKLFNFKSLIERHVTEDGLHFTDLDGFVLFRGSQAHSAVQELYQPMMVFCVQGHKKLTLGEQVADFKTGTACGIFLPLPVICEVIEASEEAPLLGGGLVLDPVRLSKMMLKLDRLIEGEPQRSGDLDISALLTGDLSDNLMEAFTRLISCLDNKKDALVIGDAILDEIYYRFLTDYPDWDLRYHLRQKGDFALVSKAIAYIHDNLDQMISVDQLSEEARMSASGLHKKFKDIIQLSPLQYIKLVKLKKAHENILNGMSALEASYSVGYNSPAQFSREYKRQFGVSPSHQKRLRA